MSDVNAEGRVDWERVFGDVDHQRPVASVVVQNVKPPHETARNIFADDEKEIVAAAEKYGWRMASSRKAKVVLFVRGNRTHGADGADMRGHRPLRYVFLDEVWPYKKADGAGR